MKQIVKNILWVLPLMVSVTLVAREPENSNVKRKEVRQYKATACSPATAIASLDFNNVRARIENGGNMWEDRTKPVAAYEVPKGSGKRVLFAGALWMGGTSPNGQLKLAAVTFRSTGNDFWPGPLKIDGTAEVDATTCADYDRFFRAFKADAVLHNAYHEALKFDAANGTTTAQDLFPGYQYPEYMDEWPARGIPGGDPYLAPFEDYNQDGNYNPAEGDYPQYNLFAGPKDCREATRNVPRFGDTTIYWIFNDKGNIHTESGSEPIGMEIRAQAFAFADKSAINNMTFYNYVLINQGTQVLQNTYFGQWADADLGYSDDDFVGCDVSRGLGYCYNGDNDDDINGGSSPGYGQTPPAVGIDFFQGPFQDPDGLDNIGPYDSLLAPMGSKTPITYAQATSGKGIPYLGLGIGYGDGIVDNERFGMRKFLYYNRGDDPNTGDPRNAQHYYGYLNGVWKDNQRFVYGGDAHGTTGACPTGIVSLSAFCDFMFPGDSDPLNFGTLGVDYGCAWDEQKAGNNPGDRRFMQSAGPFTLTPGQVNNITVGVVYARAENGDALASLDALRKADDLAQGLFDNCFQLFEGPDAPDVAVTEMNQEVILALSNPITSNNYNETYRKVRPELVGESDPIYVFEGYIVYQVTSAQVTPADLGDQSKAKVIFQCDIRNFEKGPNGNPDFTKPITNLINYENDPELKLPVPVLKVKGSNGGIVRAIKITDDVFATGRNKKLVNNKPYYFVAVAYGYNNFGTYNPVSKSGQSEPFVSSRKNGRAGAIVPVVAIPHINSPQFGGTVINSAFGDGLIVTRHEGAGNGGLFTEIDAATEAAILRDTVAYNLTYKPGLSPVKVQVVDPLKVRNTKWDLRLVPDANGKTVTPTWVLTDKNPDASNKYRTYRSENTLDLGGEQLIIEEGISVSMAQQSYYSEGANQKTDPIGGEIEFVDNPSM